MGHYPARGKSSRLITYRDSHSYPTESPPHPTPPSLPEQPKPFTDAHYPIQRVPQGSSHRKGVRDASGHVFNLTTSVTTTTIELLQSSHSEPQWTKGLGEVVPSCIMIIVLFHPNGFHLRLHLSLNREGRWGTTDDFTTISLRFSLFSTAPWELANSGPVHSLMLSSHLFFCLPFHLPPFHCALRDGCGQPDERETCPYHCTLRLFTMVRRSSSGPIAC